MRKFLVLLAFAGISIHSTHGQTAMGDSLKMAKDSTLRAMIHADSLKVEKDFEMQEKMNSMKSRVQYPLLKGGEFSGIIPVKNPDEIPDPNMDYKLLFELTSNNKDSFAKDINNGLTEITRVLNLHIASGIPQKRLIPVIVVHGAALEAISNNAFYQKKHKMDNPNIQLVNDLINKAGAKFIACGQAMAFFEVNKEDLLPPVKVSLTAQTVLSNYQLKGYVLYQIHDE